MLNIFEVVENNGAIIHANEELGFFITWNGSATFQWFTYADNTNAYFKAVDVRTVYAVETLAMAEAEAREWVAYELESADY